MMPPNNMNTITLVAILIGATLSLNAQQTTWAGTHRIVSSTGGINSFVAAKCKTFCQLTEKDGQLTGLITRCGEDVHDISQCTESLKGTIRNQIIEWKSGGAVEDAQKKQHPYETIFRGVRDGDTIVGYFEQTWNEKGKASVTYRGLIDLERKYQSELLPASLATSPQSEVATAAQDRVSELPWVAELSKTQEDARAGNKIVVLNFTGSDWCVWCTKFDADILSKPEFAPYAATNLVMVVVDFPKANKQSDQLKTRNAQLRSRFKVEVFPTFVVFNSDGKEIGRQVGYLPGGPQAFIAKLDNFKKQ